MLGALALRRIDAGLCEEARRVDAGLRQQFTKADVFCFENILVCTFTVACCDRSWQASLAPAPRNGGRFGFASARAHVSRKSWTVAPLQKAAGAACRKPGPLRASKRG